MANHLTRPKNEIIFGKIKITLFLDKTVKFRRGKPPGRMLHLAEDEVSKYLPEVVLLSARYSNVSGRNNKCPGGKVKNSGNCPWNVVSA